MVIMEAENLFNLIDQYDPLDKNTALEFLSLSEKYPYFQLPIFYHTKSLKEQGSDHYKENLNKLALKTMDRGILKNLMETPIKAHTPFEIKKPIIEKKSNKIQVDGDNKVLIDNRRNKEINKLKLSFIDWIEFTEDKNINRELEIVEDKKSPLQDKLSIINKFIENDPKIPPIDKSENSFDEIVFDDYSNELMTETLAKVLVKQKKYKKAIRAYKILCLKYPEKNVLFASQIEKIKNLQLQ
tara:strand:+ start:4105 stop:4827 length:723 start_codon:yes stop_codon:yes gene_type:complete